VLLLDVVQVDVDGSGPVARLECLHDPGSWPVKPTDCQADAFPEFVGEPESVHVLDVQFDREPFPRLACASTLSLSYRQSPHTQAAVEPRPAAKVLNP